MFKPALSLTVNNARTVLDAGLHAIASGQTEIDLADLTAVDSAAVATLLTWQRAARENGRSLSFTNLPVALQSLAVLYGVLELVQPASLLHSASGPARRH